MRILYSHYLADDNHPAVQMINAVAGGLRSFGHDVFIQPSFRAPQSTVAAGRPATSVRRGLKAAVKGKLWFLKAMARNRAMLRNDLAAIDDFCPDVVLARQDAYCWSMPLACRRYSLPLVTYADAPVAYETRLFGEQGRWHPPGLPEMIERRVLRRSRAAVTVSHPAANRLRRYGLDVPVYVVPNGVHPQRFPETSLIQRSTQRDELCLSAPLVIGFQGTFRPFHGIDRLGELMLATADRDDVQWLLIGDGPQRRELEQAVAGRARAVFVGMQPARRVGRLLSLVDVAVVPHVQVAGDFYFCPLKILEFAAAGCAVIASRQGDIPMLLDGGRAGLLVAEPTLDAWRAALERLLDDGPLRRSLGCKARRFVLSHYTWRHTARRVERVLVEALSDRGRESRTAEGEPAELVELRD